MKGLKQILEGLLRGQADTIANGESDVKSSLGIPTLDDFRWNYSSGCSVYFPCAEILRKYRGYSWCPWNSSGLQFSIFKNIDKKCFLTVSFCSENEKFASRYAKELKGWQYNKYADKPVGYWKKVVISLIKHIAENPKAFETMLDYNMEIYKDIACKQSYDDGRYMKWKEFDELFKIKG